MAAIISDWFEITPFLPRLHSTAADLGFCQRLVAKGGVTIADDGGVGGFAAWDAPMLTHLYMRADLRGGGTGQRLLDARKAESDRIDLWCFQANTEARAFYTAEGFAEHDRTDGRACEEQLPDIRFHWHRGGETA